MNNFENEVTELYAAIGKALVALIAILLILWGFVIAPLIIISLEDRLQNTLKEAVDLGYGSYNSNGNFQYFIKNNETTD